MKKNLLLFFVLFLISRYSFALVDYTETESVKAPAPRANTPTKTVSSNAPSRIQQNYAPSGMFELAAKYGVLNAQVGELSGKVDVAQFHAHFETGYNIWLDANWALGSFNGEGSLGEGSSQKGNPQILLGVNWLELGAPAERAAVDFVAGVNLAQKNSYFATSRSDKVVGVDTTKRFSSFVFGLSYRLWLTGSASASEELNIGNIQRLSASLGWRVSPDIQFAVEGATVRLGTGDGERALIEKTSFGTLAPSLHLSLAPSVALEMGAVFRTKRLKNEELLQARLWNLPGSYGNYLYAGLGLSL